MNPPAPGAFDLIPGSAERLQPPDLGRATDPKYPKSLLGKANGTIANRASGGISVWVGTFGSESDSGEDLTAFNLGPSVDLDDWVNLEAINDQWAFAKLCS